MSSSKIVSISLPMDMSKEVEELAKKERRTVSEIFREAFRQYYALQALQDVRKQAQKTAKRKKIKPEDIEAIIDELRK